jgi:hypothetical protein
MGLGRLVKGLQIQLLEKFISPDPAFTASEGLVA